MWRINSKQYAVSSVQYGVRSKEKRLHTSYFLLPTNKKGFTLIELLVAASILGMIAVAIFAAFAGGLNVYERVQTYGGVQADVLLSLEKMERDLRNVFTFSEIDFVGDSKRVAFAGLIREIDPERNQNISLGRLSYYFDSETGTLVKEEQNYPQAVSKIGTEKNNSEVLSFVENVNFSYYYFDSKNETYKWKDLWNADEGIPKGVKVEVTFKDGGRNVKLVRTVLIPISS